MKWMNLKFGSNNSNKNDWEKTVLMLYEDWARNSKSFIKGKWLILKIKKKLQEIPQGFLHNSCLKLMFGKNKKAKVKENQRN